MQILYVFRPFSASHEAIRKLIMWTTDVRDNRPDIDTVQALLQGCYNYAVEHEGRD